MVYTRMINHFMFIYYVLMDENGWRDSHFETILQYADKLSALWKVTGMLLMNRYAVSTNFKFSQFRYQA